MNKIKVRIKTLSLILTTVLLALTGVITQAATCDAIQVTAQALSVRTGPSTAYTRVGYVQNGEKYVKLATQGNWAKIWFDTGTKWLYASNYTQTVSADCGKVNIGTLNVRRGPSTNYSIAGTVPLNSEWVKIGSSGNWSQIFYKSEKRWVYGRYLDTSTPPPPISVSNFVINNNDPSTNSQFVSVTQTINGSTASHYQLSENAFFSAASWNTYDSSVPFTLTAGNGNKVLHYRVKNAEGRVSNTVSDSIELAVPIDSVRSIDASVFFTEYRKQFGSMSQGQVDGMNFLIKNMEEDKEAAYKNLSVFVRQMAYLWATVKLEVANTYQPITEYGNSNCPRYDGGCTYKGRGYVQLTHKYNYQAMSPIVNVDLVANPLLALDPDIAYRVMSYGSFNGVFTGRSLGQYIKSGLTDYYNARRVINGTNKASLIKSYAEKFETVMVKATN